jgi:AraC family ethanolamine operon transcriptional activator
LKKKVFTEFDEFAESIRDVESKMMFRNVLEHVWTTSSVVLPHINVQSGELGSGNIAQGELRSDGCMIYLPRTSDVEYSANGQILADGAIAVLEPGCEFSIATKDPHDWYAVFVPNELLPNHRTNAGASGVKESHDCWVAEGASEKSLKFRQIIQDLLSAAECSTRFEASKAGRLAEAKLVKLIASIIEIKPVEEGLRTGRRRLPHKKIVDRSVELIEQNDGERISIRDLAQSANVSERTLRNTFNEYFGVGPTQYQILRQLRETRRALLSGDPETTLVADVLLGCGVWEFSRFATRYKQQFGELPSETLRKTER